MATRLLIGVIMLAALGAAPVSAETAVPVGDENVVARRCPQINIGTAEKPRYVPDPGCGSRR